MTDFSRRKLLTTSAGVAALGLTGTLAFLPAAQAADVRKKGYYSYKVGDIEVISIYDGIWEKLHDENFVIGSSISEVTEVLQTKGFSGDYVPVEFAFCVVKTAGQTILMDAGVGTGVLPLAGTGVKGLEEAGIKVEDVDKVVLSHLHPDHFFGLYKTGTNDLIYDNAEILVGEIEYNYWSDPSVISALPERRRGGANRIQETFPTWKNLALFKHDQEIAPGIRGVDMPGHSPGHMGFHLSSGGEQLLLLGDLIIVPALFLSNLNWQLQFDADKDQASESRKKIVERAVAENLSISGYHFGFPNNGKIEKDGSGFVFNPV